MTSFTKILSNLKKIIKTNLSKITGYNEMQIMTKNQKFKVLDTEKQTKIKLTKKRSYIEMLIKIKLKKKRSYIKNLIKTSLMKKRSYIEILIKKNLMKKASFIKKIIKTNSKNIKK